MTLSRLGQLDTIVFEPGYSFSPDVRMPRLVSLESRLAIPETRPGVAEDFMASCPSLRHFALSVASEGEWKGLMSFTRSRVGDTVFEGWDILGEESWREI